MDTNYFSFKELYDVYLKLTYPIEIKGKKFEEGETIAKFDKIQMSNFQETKKRITARGGFDNRDLVFWEDEGPIQINFYQGVFSKTHFALLSNSKIFDLTDQNIILTRTVEKESNEQGQIELQEKPLNIFIYNKNTDEKIKDFIIEDKIIKINEPFLTVVIIYTYNYTNGGQVIKIGQNLIQGFLTLEGKTKIKDDESGQVTTGLIKIPKLKLMSDLSIRLGTQASPVTANFSAVGIPVGSRKEAHVGEFYFLNNDIDSDF